MKVSDVTIWVKYSWVGRKTTYKQTNPTHVSISTEFKSAICHTEFRLGAKKKNMDLWKSRDGFKRNGVVHGQIIVPFGTYVCLNNCFRTGNSLLQLAQFSSHFNDIYEINIVSHCFDRMRFKTVYLPYLNRYDTLIFVIKTPVSSKINYKSSRIKKGVLKARK